jgi:hypothetical protein
MLTLQTTANEKQKENMRKLKEQEAELLVSAALIAAKQAFICSFHAYYML